MRLSAKREGFPNTAFDVTRHLPLTFKVQRAPIALLSIMGVWREIIAVLSVLRHTCVYFVLGFTACLIENAVEQPHCAYSEPGVTWFSVAISGSLFLGALLAVPMCITMFLNTLGNTNCDTKYHPQLKDLAGLWRLVYCRWTLITGAVLISTYWVYTATEYIQQQSHRCGLIWPPYRIAVTVLFSWAVLWLADILRRPSRQTLPSCIVFLILTSYFMLTMGFGFVRE